jgi:hypothetical protein
LCIDGSIDLLYINFSIGPTLSVADINATIDSLFNPTNPLSTVDEALASGAIEVVLAAVSKLPPSNDEQGMKHVGADVRAKVEAYFASHHPVRNSTAMNALMDEYHALSPTATADGKKTVLMNERMERNE